MEKGKCVSRGKTADPVQLLLSVSLNGGGCTGKMLYLVMGLLASARGALSVPNPNVRSQLRFQPPQPEPRRSPSLAAPGRRGPANEAAGCSHQPHPSPGRNPHPQPFSWVQRALILPFVDLFWVCASSGSTNSGWAKPACRNTLGQPKLAAPSLRRSALPQTFQGRLCSDCRVLSVATRFMGHQGDPLFFLPAPSQRTLFCFSS